MLTFQHRCRLLPAPLTLLVLLSALFSGTIMTALSSDDYQATPGDASIDNEPCAICREPMRVGTLTSYLLCEHQVHSSCLIDNKIPGHRRISTFINSFS
ncbi:unnamed protein product (mitochondrion) [Plasmodiophora brassicae]|uniref:RING-type domain-containing protein n=1 Tax=Plasmodiophora brassicae TaxID=37360 RepID=A0A3P3YDX1_PLABS|nr:unnamed protein product [Plasmodiophora brassicae]